jgi:hypothetical protein
MHLKLDDEIYQVESRIVGRKQLLAREGRETGRRALDGLASPLTLAGALALGFAVGGGLWRRKEKPPQRRRDDRLARAKASGIVGLAMSGAMWFIKHQFGGPVGLAKFISSKLQLQEKFQRHSAAREYPAREFPPRV